MSWLLRVAGRSIYPWQNSPITTVIRRAYIWHLMRHSIGGHVDLWFVGQKRGLDTEASSHSLEPTEEPHMAETSRV